MTEFAHLHEQTLSSKEIYDGQIVQVYVDTVTLANGQQATREVVRHCPAVAVLAITNDDKVVLVRQFRYPIDKPLLEVPAGKMDGDESETPEGTAARES